MSPEELRSFPNSPVTKIKMESDARIRTNPNPLGEAVKEDVGQVKSLSAGRGRANSAASFESSFVGLPVQLKSQVRNYNLRL